jgi:hypothetical protein
MAKPRLNIAEVCSFKRFSIASLQFAPRDTRDRHLAGGTAHAQPLPREGVRRKPRARRGARSRRRLLRRGCLAPDHRCHRAARKQYAARAGALTAEQCPITSLWGSPGVKQISTYGPNLRRSPSVACAEVDGRRWLVGPEAARFGRRRQRQVMPLCRPPVCYTEGRLAKAESGHPF